MKRFQETRSQLGATTAVDGSYRIPGLGRVAVEGVELYCDSCRSPVGLTFASTDAAGPYSFAWSMNGGHALLVRKDGYALARADGNDGSGTEYILASVTGDTHVDIEVVRR
jgi:hypothetical protein